MGKTLIITEKPSVAREYADILKVKKSNKKFFEGDEYIITWCVGHLIEMSYPEAYDERYKTWKIKDLPFLPVEYKYSVIASVREQYKTVNSLMHREDVSEILYAGDSGREGEVIMRLIRNYGGVGSGILEKRVWIDSYTEDEVRRGIREAKPLSEYDNLADAGIMRSIEDYAMGINFSRAISIKYGAMINKQVKNKKYRPIAVGRVMTCVLGMVVRREREIRDFKVKDFYKIFIDIESKKGSFIAEWRVSETSKYLDSDKLYNDRGFKEEEEARGLISTLELSKNIVSKKEVKKERVRPPLLYNLAELQAECTKKFSISPDETLKIAQKLYENKLITYPRTDARVMSVAVSKEIKNNLEGLVKLPMFTGFIKEILENKSYLNLSKTQYVNDLKIKDHYAILPTGSIKKLSEQDELSKGIYELIVRRFLAIFYKDAVYKRINMVISIESNDGFVEEFTATARSLVEEGFLPILSKQREDDKEEDKLEVLDSLKKGDRAKIKKIDTKKSKTTPPKRYTSGSMILAMENAGKLIEDDTLRETIRGAGIGTSATRAGIIEKLIKIGYLSLNKKTQILSPRPFGEMVFEATRLAIPAMLNPEMTASWELGLSEVENGKITKEEYMEVLNKYVIRYVENIKTKDFSGQLSLCLERINK